MTWKGGKMRLSFHIIVWSSQMYKFFILDSLNKVLLGVEVSMCVVDGLTSRFIWKGNTWLQVKLKSQHRPFCKRGLQFPNFCLFQIRTGWNWQAEYADSYVSQRLEESQIEGVLLAAAPFILLSYWVESYCQSIIITCKVWTDIKKSSIVS